MVVKGDFCCRGALGTQDATTFSISGGELGEGVDKDQLQLKDQENQSALRQANRLRLRRLTPVGLSASSTKGLSDAVAVGSCICCCDGICDERTAAATRGQHASSRPF